MFFVEGFEDVLKGDGDDKPKTTLLLIEEGDYTIDINRLVGEPSDLSQYEDVLPAFNENDAAYRWVHADSLIDGTLRDHEHVTPEKAFYYEYYGRDVGFKDLEQAKLLFEGEESFKEYIWSDKNDLKIRREHSYYHLVKTYREWQHRTKWPNCLCMDRPHLDDKVYPVLEAAENCEESEEATDEFISGDTPFCGVVESCEAHFTKNCAKCIEGGKDTILVLHCVDNGHHIHLSSWQGVIGKFLRDLPSVVWGWKSAEARNCDKYLREHEDRWDA